MVLASDGIWEFLENHQVVNLIAPFYQKSKPFAACNKLIKEAIALWKLNDNVIDDITLIVLFFGNKQPSSAQNAEEPKAE